MIHICVKCGKARNCGCGDCGEKESETCTGCNNSQVLPFAEFYKIPLKELGLDPLGGYHIKSEHLERWNEWSKNNES